MNYCRQVTLNYSLPQSMKGNFFSLLCARQSLHAGAKPGFNPAAARPVQHLSSRSPVLRTQLLCFFLLGFALLRLAGSRDLITTANYRHCAESILLALLGGVNKKKKRKRKKSKALLLCQKTEVLPSTHLPRKA